MVDWQPFIAFCVKNELMFKIWVQIILCILAIGVFYLAFKSRRWPEKEKHPEYFINEILVGILFIVAVVMFPMLFNKYSVEPVRAQVYFHIWNSLNVNFLMYGIHFIIGNINKKKLGIKFTREEFNANFLKNYNDSLWADIQRKWLHLIPPALGILLVYIGRWLKPMLESQGWSGDLLVIFMLFSVGIHFLVILTESDIFRLVNMNIMTRWSADWCSHALRPKELHTLTTAEIMLLSQFIFIFAPLPVLLAVLWLSALSDATASIIGKTFSKIGRLNRKIGKSPKTYIGLLAGSGMTYAVVWIVHAIVPFVDATILQIHAMGLIAAIAFAFIDVFAKRIYDNFLNPMVCGTLIWLIYVLF